MGNQLSGLFQYDKNHMKGIYSLKHKSYITLEEFKTLEKKIGAPPPLHVPWKKLHKDKEKNRTEIAFRQFICEWAKLK